MKKEESKTHKEVMEEIKTINKHTLIFLLERLKGSLEVNAGKLIESARKKGNLPQEEKDCYDAMICVAHLEAVEKYVNTL